jgi:hypothetical protein
MSGITAETNVAMKSSPSTFDLSFSEGLSLTRFHPIRDSQQSISLA